MTEVVDLDAFRPKKVELVWECSCGSQLFFMQVDGSIQCRSCLHIMERIEWMYRADPT